MPRTPREIKDRIPRERKVREPAPDEQGRPTQEAGGPCPAPRREQCLVKQVLRE